MDFEQQILDSLATSRAALVFHEQAHEYYNLDNVQVPSVTQILDLCDAWDFAHRPPPEWAMERGSIVHKMLEFDDEGVLETYDPELEGYLESWRSYRESLGPHRVIANESRVYHKAINVAGTLDRIWVEDDKPLPVLVDLKCGSFRPAAALQTAAYQQALGVPCQRRVVVVHADGRRATPNDLPLERNAADWRSFLAMHETVAWKVSVGLLSPDYRSRESDGEEAWTNWM